MAVHHRSSLTVANDFQEIHIPYVWEELHARFGFDIQKWSKDKFPMYLRQQRHASRLDAFMTFGNDRINPLLNELLCRPVNHPTFNRLLHHVLQKRSPS